MKEYPELDKAVCEYIIKAQMCSDTGKGIYNTYYHPSWLSKAEKYEYAHKPLFVRKAMDRISQLKGRSGFHFYVQPHWWASGYYCPIVYFNFRLDGKRRQISFHMPDMWGKRRSATEQNHITRWDKKLEGSRDACWDLGDYLRKSGKKNQGGN